MDADATCPHCGTLFTVRRELLGKRSKCTRCGNAFVLTETARVATPPPAMPVHASSPGASSVFHDTPMPSVGPPPGMPVAPPNALPSAMPAFTFDPTPPAAARTQRQPGEMLGLEKSPSQPRFPALRIVAKAYEIGAIFVLAFAVIMLVMLVLSLFGNPSAAAAYGGAFFSALIAALTMLFLGQSIRLGLQVEQNTRETQIACRQLADHLCSVESER